MAKRWYVIHVQTGSEEKVKVNLETQIKAGKAEDSISRILIPEETVSEIKGGKKKISQRKIFPGYILVEMEMTDKSWYFIRNTQGVSGFIGARTRPVALKEQEVKTIIKQTERAKEKPTPKVTFDIGEGVRVVNGPFANFNGAIQEIHPEKGKLKVAISIFGRATPMELEYWQVEKL